MLSAARKIKDAAEVNSSRLFASGEVTSVGPSIDFFKALEV